MDLLALARARQAVLRVGSFLIMVGAMIVGTAPGDWLAVGEHEQRDAAAILHDAELAMYAARNSGGGASQYGDPANAELEKVGGPKPSHLLGG